MAIAIGLSAWQRLGLTWNLTLATGRTILQLLIVGYLLAFVFAWQNLWAILAVIGVMVTIATIEARNRIGKTLPHLLPWLWGSIFFQYRHHLALYHSLDPATSDLV